MAVDVIVAGAGIAGLTAARLLAKNGVKVTVVEARSRAGGRIHTWDNDNKSTFSSSTQQHSANLVDLGASFVHGIIGNPIVKLQKDVSLTFRQFYHLLIFFVCQQANFHLVVPKEDSTPVWIDRGGGEKWSEELSEKAGYFAHATVFERLHEVAQSSDHIPSDEETLWTGLLNKGPAFKDVWNGVKAEEKAQIFAM